MKHTLGAAFDYYLSSNDLSASSLKSYAAVKAKLEKGRFLTRPISEFSRPVFRLFLNKLKNRDKMMESTIFSIYYVKIKGVIQFYCRDHSLHPIDLEGIIKSPKVEFDKAGEEPYFTLREMRNLEAADITDPDAHYARELFLFMCCTGCSVADLKDLMPADNISLDHNGKRVFIYGRTKNNQRGIVPVIGTLLDKIIERNVWPVKYQERKIQQIVPLLSKTMGRKVTCHMARKTLGCIMLEVGFSLESVSKMLGHTSVITTQKYYARISDEKISRETVNLKPEMIELMS